MSKASYAIYTGIVLLSMVGVFFMTGGITGMATSDSSDKPLGTYEIYPHITTDVGFSLDQYKQLRIDARKLLDTMKKCDQSITPTKDQCLQASLETLQLGWRVNCGSGLEGFQYDFAEFLQLCSGSADNGCMCRMDYKQKNYQPGEYSVIVRPIGEKAVIESALMQSLEIDAKATMQEVGGQPRSGMDYGAMKISLKYAGSLSESKLTLIDNTAVQNSLDLNGMVSIYKQDKTLLLVAPNDLELYKEAPACTIPEKRIYIFCATAEQVTSTDASGKARQDLLTYRFALEP